MHIYGSLASPFVQRALMTARAKGHELEVRPPRGGGMQSDAFRAISPMGRIPVLATDDDATICESEAICGYLDETLSGPKLLPDDPLARARVREIVAVATLEYATGMRPLMVHLVFRKGDSPDVVAAARAQAGQGLDALDRMLAGRQGGPLTAADCALVPMLALAQAISPIAGTGEEVAARLNVAAYWEAVQADPIAARSIAEMRQAFAAMMTRNAAPVEPAPPGD